MATYTIGDVAGSLKGSDKITTSKLSDIFKGKERTVTWEKLLQNTTEDDVLVLPSETKTGKKRKLEDDEVESMPKKRKPRHKSISKASKETIFVGNVPVSTGIKKIKKLFSKYGTIVTTRFRNVPQPNPAANEDDTSEQKTRVGQRPNKNAFITFKSEDEAAKALEFNGQMIDDFYIRVDLASNSQLHDHKRSIFLGNLPFQVTDNEVYKHFEECGEIANVRIIRDKETGCGKGFGYVEFKSEDSITLALQLKNSTLKGRELRISRAAKKMNQKKVAAKAKFTKGEKRKPDKKTTPRPKFENKKTDGKSFRGIAAKPTEKKKRKARKPRKKAAAAPKKH